MNSLLDTAAREVATDRVFRMPDRLTRGGFEQMMGGYADRLAEAVGPGGIAIERLPLGPFGGTLADLGYTGLTLPPDRVGRPTQGHDYGVGLLQAGMNAIRRGPLPLKDAPPAGGKPEAPDFPGFDVPAGEIINWVNFYRGVKAKFPEELSFAALKEQAKNFLIERGVKFLEEQLKKLAVDAVMGVLGPAMDDALATAAKATDGLLDQIGGFLNDPLGTIQGALLSALPNLAGKGIDALLGGLFGDDAKLSPGELVAKMAAKEMLSGMSAALLEGVGSFDQLAANFENIQDKLYGQLRKYFTGGEFTPGKATMPLARVGDKDDKVDAIAAGCGTVIAEGMAAARLTDPLAPSGQVVAIGSETVMIGGMPAARQGSLTAVVSTLASGAAQVLVEGATMVSVTPEGVPYCVSDPKAAAAALTKGAAGAAGAGGAGGAADGGVRLAETKPGALKDILAQVSHGEPARPSGPPLEYRKASDGTLVPVYETSDLPADHKAEYLLDSEGKPWIAVVPGLPERERASSIAHELGHTNDDIADGAWDKIMGSGSCTQSEILARDQQITHLRENASKWPRGQAEQEIRRIQAEIEALRTGRTTPETQGVVLKADLCDIGHEKRVRERDAARGTPIPGSAIPNREEQERRQQRETEVEKQRPQLDEEILKLIEKRKNQVPR